MGEAFDKDPLQKHITRWIMLLTMFIAPIAFMNTFIAAMVNSYMTGSNNVERIYESRLANAVFSTLCFRMGIKPLTQRIQKPLRWLRCIGRRKEKDGSDRQFYLW